MGKSAWLKLTLLKPKRFTANSSQSRTSTVFGKLATQTNKSFNLMPISRSHQTQSATLLVVLNTSTQTLRLPKASSATTGRELTRINTPTQPRRPCTTLPQNLTEIFLTCKLTLEPPRKNSTTNTTSHECRENTCK